MPRQRKTRVQTVRPTANARAAGIDIGAREIYAAVPTELSTEPVRSFPTFTEDLHELVKWLQGFQIKTVAMEATSVYWIPLAELLEEVGIEVCLVNPRHVKNVPGRKSDVMDCQWLQYLHSVGLLRGAFRPAPEVRASRALWRHRDALIRHSGWHIQHMHKALDQMNLQIHHVITDITGVTGTAIVEAILAGERDPARMATLRDPRVRATGKTLQKALTGDYRDEHLFCLKQSYEGYKFVQQQIVSLDVELEQRLAAMRPVSAPDQKESAKPISPEDRRALLARLHGVDLCTIPGLNVGAVQTLWCEIGGDLSDFPSPKHFCSWTGLSPDNRISGGKILSASTKVTANRVARALRLAAQALHHGKHELGDYYRRMRARLGGAAAVTAVAHKLARIVYAMLKTHQPYRSELHDEASSVNRQRTLIRLQAKARNLGFQLIPTSASE
jgi:transposase